MTIFIQNSNEICRHKEIPFSKEKVRFLKNWWFVLTIMVLLNDKHGQYCFFARHRHIHFDYFLNAPPDAQRKKIHGGYQTAGEMMKLEDRVDLLCLDVDTKYQSCSWLFTYLYWAIFGINILLFIIHK